MLSTKDMSAGSGKAKPVIVSGNQELKINSITLNAPAYDQSAYDLIINAESKPMGEGFEGFLLDQNNPNGPRYKGQVGRVKFSRYSFSDTTLPSGMEIQRDPSILKALINLAENAGKRAEVDSIQASTIEDFVSKASALLSGETYYNFCVGGREWENKEGYTNLDLFLPKFMSTEVPFESVGAEPSKIMTFDQSKHVIALKKKSNDEVVSAFGPAATGGLGGDDFDL
tara:strand:- start:11 stop:691 length:681 start_codon:yes stop_codon:yes gene_type:complete